jgi:hypothetical protein
MTHLKLLEIENGTFRLNYSRYIFQCTIILSYVIVAPNERYDYDDIVSNLDM